jgi:hypothetical protein
MKKFALSNNALMRIKAQMQEFSPEDLGGGSSDNKVYLDTPNDTIKMLEDKMPEIENRLSDLEQSTQSLEQSSQADVKELVDWVNYFNSLTTDTSMELEDTVQRLTQLEKSTGEIGQPLTLSNERLEPSISNQSDKVQVDPGYAEEVKKQQQPVQKQPAAKNPSKKNPLKKKKFNPWNWATKQIDHLRNVDEGML